MRSNPYSPGLAARPPLLAGRQHWRTMLEETYEAAEQDVRAVQPLVFHGIRGIGKTALLTALRDQARDRRWAAERVEASPSASLALSLAARADQMVDGLPGTASRRARALRAQVRSVSVGLAGISGEIAFAEPQPRTAQLHDLVRDLFVTMGTIAREHGVGVAFLIDELQDAPVPDLRALAAAIQATAEDSLPVVVVGAGLPGTRRHLMDAVTYAERIRFVTLGNLEPAATVAALVEPARSLGVTWESDALDLVVDRSEGYPYLIQLYGQHTWESADGADRLTAAHVDEAEPVVWETLDEGAYGHRWDQLAEGDRLFLLAMAALLADGRPATSTGVATHLGRTTQELSVTRARLIERGLVTAPARDQLHFALPGFARYLDRREPG